MFDNIGEKIKSFAKFYCWVGIILSVIAGNVLLAIASNTYSDMEEVYSIVGISILIGGPINSWVISIFLYGFGKLVENSDTLVAEKKSNKTEIANPIETISDKIDTLKKWREQGLITEEEFNQKMENLK